MVNSPVDVALPRGGAEEWAAGDARAEAGEASSLCEALCLYRRAWATRAGVDLADVGTMVSFLVGSSHYALEELKVLLGTSGAFSLDVALRDALGRKGLHFVIC